jgi:16S rRNA (cytidine1402-2'-O)-methyltransferase
VVATPIGNLDDLSPRALATLKSVDRIYAEDTRTSSVLLSHHGVRTPLKALHAHNEAQAAAEVLDYLRAGHSAALISDAGTPAISDPGAVLVAQVHAAGLSVQVLPGPNAAVAALSAAGLPGPFSFIGFLPAKSAARRKALEEWHDFPHSLLLYEAPHRVLECVEDIAAVMGAEREIVIARELTKLFEQIHRCRAGEAAAWLREDANRQRGEFVIVIAGAPAQEDALLAEGGRVLKILLDELPLKQAAKLAAQISGARKNQLYELGLQSAKMAGKPEDDE